LMVDPATNKWTSKSFIEVKMKNLLDDDVIREVENALVYFIVASAIHLRSELPSIMVGLNAIWDAETSSLSAMDYANSLTTSSPDENIGKNPQPTQNVSVQKVSSIPS